MAAGNKSKTNRRGFLKTAGTILYSATLPTVADAEDGVAQLTINVNLTAPTAQRNTYTQMAQQAAPSGVSSLSINPGGLVSNGSWRRDLLSRLGISALFFQARDNEGNTTTIPGIPEHGCLATTTPLPTTLCDVQVKISGEAQPLFGVFNTGQVNLQLGDYAGDADVTIEYKGQDGTITSEPQRVTIDADATPTVLSYQRFGHPHAVAVHPDGDIVGYTAGTKPLAPGETTTLYFIGAAEARVQAGETAPLDELLQHSGLTVKRNGKPVLASDILYIGSTPGSVGLSQLNLINNGTPGLDEITIEGPQGKGTTALLATAEPGNNTMIVEMATLTSDDRTEAYSGELLDAQTGDVLSTIRGREGLDIAQYRGSKQGEEADAVFTGDGHYTHVRPITLGADDIKFDKIPIRTLPGSRVRFNPLARGDEGPQFRYKYAFNDPNVDEEELNSMMVEIFSNLKSPGTGLGIAAPLQITGPQYDGKLHVRFDTSQEQYQALRKYITSWNTVQELMIEDQTDFENRGQSGIIIVSVR